MHYEVYIDIFFFTNFMMDSLLLFAVRSVLKCKVPVWRVFLGSTAGTALTCVVFVLPLSGIVKGLLVLPGIGTLMLGIGLAVYTWQEWRKAIGVLFVSAFLLGGILQAFRPYLRTGSLFFAVAAAAYGILDICWNLLVQVKNNRKKICEVVLFSGDKNEKVQALIDTGNRLTDPISKEPVHVIDRKTAALIGCDVHTFRYIPYRTVNGTGVMPVIRAEKMCIKGEQECFVERPILGICGEMISEQDEYQMILNADII